MSNGWYVLGAVFSFLAGFFAAVAIVALTITPTGTLSKCRAANPGYDCSIGWVKGKAFE